MSMLTLIRDCKCSDAIMGKLYFNGGLVCYTLENRNKAANAARSLFHVCPDCGNVVWSMGEIACSCCSHCAVSVADFRSFGTMSISCLPFAVG